MRTVTRNSRKKLWGLEITFFVAAGLFVNKSCLHGRINKKEKKMVPIFTSQESYKSRFQGAKRPLSSVSSALGFASEPQLVEFWNSPSISVV